MNESAPVSDQTPDEKRSHRANLTGPELRVGALQGDRLCTNCHYNLTGQSIVRESQYDLLIVRCPECGAVASVQEYPLLGRWSSRWASVAAAMFVLFVFSLFAATVLIMFAFTLGASEQAAWGLSTVIDQRFQAWQSEQMATMDPANQPSWQVWQQMFQTWWATQDLDLIISDSGGWWGIMGWRPVVVWVPLSLTALALGVIWSTVLLHMKRRRLMIFGCLVIAITAAVLVSMLIEWFQTDQFWSWAIARREMGPRIAIITLAIGGVMLFIGLMIGRPVVRVFVCAMLPPRLRGALAVLWIADGLPPPATRH